MITSVCLLFAETNDDTGVPDTVPMSAGGVGQSPPDGAGEHLLFAVLYPDDFHRDIIIVV
jgi:hypothetical protein